MGYIAISAHMRGGTIIRFKRFTPNSEMAPSQNRQLRNHLIRQSIYKTIYERMKADAAIYLFGEGAQIKVHYDAPYIEQAFPSRVLTLPISEDGNTNFVVGASLVGVKPVVDVVSSDFLLRTMDSICNTAAKLDSFSSVEEEPRTIVIRSEFFLGGPTTGQRLESLFTHIPGLNVVVPSNPKDASGLMSTVLSTQGVALFFEERMIDDAIFHEMDLDNDSSSPIPLGKARIRRTGSDLTIASYGLSVSVTESILEDTTISCDFIDLRTLYPLDYQTVCDSVNRTGRLLIVEPDITFAGIGSELAAIVCEKCFSSLEKPIRRLGSPRITIPANHEFQKELMPTGADILKAIGEVAGI